MCKCNIWEKVKSEKPNNNISVSILAALIPANLVHLFWTVWLTVEQIKTGWKGGTGIEMLALAPWTLQLLTVPLLLLCVAYFVLSCYRKQRKRLLIGNIALFACLVAQIFMTDLFMFY